MVAPQTTSLDQQAQQRLASHPYIALRKVSCRHDDGVLILLGKVPSYHLKQLAQEAVGTLPGVQGVDNRIQVHAS